MADGSYLLIYRSMTTGDLLDLKDKLVGNLTSISSMAVGSKSLTRDLSTLKDQLEAIVFVLNERSTPCGYPRATAFDFGGAQNQGQPAGTTDQLSY